MLMPLPPPHCRHLNVGEKLCMEPISMRQTASWTGKQNLVDDYEDVSWCITLVPSRPTLGARFLLSIASSSSSSSPSEIVHPFDPTCSGKLVVSLSYDIPTHLNHLDIPHFTDTDRIFSTSSSCPHPTSSRPKKVPRTSPINHDDTAVLHRSTRRDRVVVRWPAHGHQ